MHIKVWYGKPAQIKGALRKAGCGQALTNGKIGQQMTIRCKREDSESILAELGMLKRVKIGVRA